MSSWRQRRKFIYLSSVIIILAIAIAIPLYLNLYHAPTCFDNKQNQKEEGIDCGGGCSAVCSFSTINPIIRWARAFPIVSGKYTAVAYIENPNTDAAVSEIAYNFKFYDDKNVLLAERNGKTFIPAKKSFPIFETNIGTGFREIKKTFFQFTEVPNWQKVTKDELSLTVVSKDLGNEGTAPKLSAIISNPNLVSVKGIAVVAILYDRDDNAIASSATYIESIAKESTSEAIFTWPAPFSASATRIEIYPRIYPAR